MGGPVDTSQAAKGRSERGARPGGGSLGTGCLKGCAVVLLVLVFAFFAFWFWLSRPGSQRSTAAVVSEESAGWVRFAPPEDDAGVEALRHALREAVEAEVARAPGPFRTLLSGIADRFAPTELTLSYEPPGPGEPVVTITAFNPKGYTHLLEGLVSLAGAGRGDEWDWPPYRGIETYRREGLYWAFLGGTGLVAESQRVLERGIDRLLDRDGGEDMSGVELPPSPPGGWDLTGYFRDGALVARELGEQRRESAPGEELAREELAREELAAALASTGPVTFGADVGSRGRLAGTAWIEASSAAEAARLADALRRAIVGSAPASAEVTVSTSGARVVAEVVFSMLSESIFGGREAANQPPGRLRRLGGPGPRRPADAEHGARTRSEEVDGR